MSEGVFKADIHKESGLLIAAFPYTTSEEVIRCRDCFYWRDEDFCINSQWQANAPSRGLIEFPCTTREDFCSFAEPREDQYADGGE